MSQATETHRVVRTLLWIFALAAFAVAVGVVLRTVFTNYTTDLSATGGTFWDFRDAGYYPVRAALDGVLPYDVDRYLASYPVAQEFPLLPPTYMVFHSPFQVLDLTSASVVMFGLNLLGMVLLSAWSVSLSRYRVTPLLVLFVSALAIVSNGGRNALYTGQVTVLFVAGVYLALTASRAGSGALGVFIALVKPAMGLPVTLLVAATGRYRRAVTGAAVAAAVSATLMLPFVAWAGGIGPLSEILLDNAEYSAGSQWVSLETTTARVDLSATIAMLFDVVPPSGFEIILGMAVICGSAVLLFLRRENLYHLNHGDAVIVLVCLVTVTGIYHSFYDLVILVLPAVVLTRRDFAGGAAGHGLRWVMFGAVVMAAFNPFRIDSVARALSGTPRAVEILGPGLTGASLAVALVLAVIVVWRLPAQVTGHMVRPESS